jgi:hypothetical protein
LLLLSIGIHNAWDTTTYNVFVNNPNVDSAEISDSTAAIDDLDDIESSDHQKQ